MAKVMDKRQKNRRFRDILANSGLVMESGEVRDIPNLYVMSYDGELINVNDLNKDPEKQTEQYSVKAQADHGEVDDAGYLISTVEKQFGSCRVWTEDDGLHARVYFANDDSLADHLFAISDDASYSIGTEWAEPGFEWNGKVYQNTIGILREISMVITGNDPRARTTDHKAEATGPEGASQTDGKENNKENNSMGTTKKDTLTPDEREALVREIVDKIDDFTTNAPESETEPTARDNAEAEGEKTEDTAPQKEQAKSEKKDSKTVGMPVLVINNKTNDGVRVRNERAAATDWLTGEGGHRAFADCLKRAGKLGATFDGMWRAELEKHTSLDGITGLPTPSNIVSMFRDALEKNDGIISHFEVVGAKGLKINLITAVSGSEDLARAHGFKKGDTKVNQELANTTREILCKMVYKRLPLDAMEVWENPELIDFRARELVEAIIVEIERAAFTGDGRSAPTGNAADLRMYDGASRGFISIKSDAAATSGFGTLVATTYTQESGDNAYDTIVKARANIRKEGRQYIVAKNSWVSTALTAKVGSNYLVQPGMKIEDVLGVERVYTPAWMDNDTNDAYLVVDKAYKMIGENQIRTHADFDTSTNENILLDETPRGGALGEYKSAVAIAPAAAAQQASSK